MQSIDEKYRAAAGVRDRREYKLFYSHIHPFPLLVLGQNPGGAKDGKHYVASNSYFENWEHDFVCFRRNPEYSLAAPMCALLSQVLATHSADAVRQVPVTNVIFRRSQNTAALTLTPIAAAKEAKPYLEQIIQAVSPKVILFISKTAYDLFAKLHCRPGSVVEQSAPRVFTPNGSNSACIFLRAEGYVENLARQVPLLMVGHPSKYASRDEWPQAMEELSASLRMLQISPIENSGALCAVPALEGYETSL